MVELEKRRTYACSLAMPSPNNPICKEWVEEIARHVEKNKKDQIYLVGHSLGVPAILRYLEASEAKNVKGAVLVSGPVYKTTKKKVAGFLKESFDYKVIKTKARSFVVIHGDDDRSVSIEQGKVLAKELNADLVIVKKGGHLNGSAGWYSLPQALEGLNKLMRKKLR